MYFCKGKNGFNSSFLVFRVLFQAAVSPLIPILHLIYSQRLWVLFLVLCFFYLYMHSSVSVLDGHWGRTKAKVLWSPWLNPSIGWLPVCHQMYGFSQPRPAKPSSLIPGVWVRVNCCYILEAAFIVQHFCANSSSLKYSRHIVKASIKILASLVS